MICITGSLVLPDRIIECGSVLVAGEKIQKLVRGSKPPRGALQLDFRDCYVAPGFIDIHVHGGAGADYMDGDEAAVRQVNRAHLRHGTTTLFPTTTTASPDQIRAMIEACAKVQKHWTPADGARIGGVHLYGPYFAPNKLGCHPRLGRRDPKPEEFRRYFRGNRVRIATCAAELTGAAAFYRLARHKNCLITCGHSDASWPEMEAAFRQGVRHVDHFWCAMSSVPSVRARLGTPMRGSMEQFVLAHPEMSTEVIADGEHLAPELLNYAYRMLGPDRLCLVTDANRALDMPPGRYRFGHRDTGTWFESNGRVGFLPGKGLASSVVGLDFMVRTMARDTGAPLPEIIRMATLTPARLTGIAHQTGSLAEGKQADLVVLTKQLEVKSVMVAGKLVHGTPPAGAVGPARPKSNKPTLIRAR
ncbi:MAG: N-acetylglucosamine-6-phosphate deacetylase [Bryobacteraceae bacterium]|nr:N-acetylglucosamine-6-phosphate deacetylase [Bryobacteraceae bacterium]MDW8379894.1 N-acetylglucosamine-6-phosphate deacetylase [Bryobacterales bacterium]